LETRLTPILGRYGIGSLLFRFVQFQGLVVDESRETDGVKDRKMDVCMLAGFGAVSVGAVTGLGER